MTAWAEEAWRAEALRLDREDPLGHLRGRFYVREGECYLDGNSLGLLSKDAEQAVLTELSRWRTLGVGGWAEGSPSWFHLSERLGAMLAEIVGALPGEVVATGSTTSNLHQLLATFYRPLPGRSIILIDKDSFPTDHYAVESHVRLLGLDPAASLREVAPKGDHFDEEDIERALTPDVALAVLPGVLYRSGQLLDLPKVTAAARRAGVIVLWDLAHAAGAVPLRLHDWDVDGAFFCTYKHIAGGPGAVGALFLHDRHARRTPGMWGWFGSDKARQFDMRTDFVPAGGAGALQVGTPHILSAAPLMGALGILREAGMDRVREKSLRQTELILRMADEFLAPHGFTVATPWDPGRRGAHVALRHPESARIARALRARRVIPDFRAPDIVRLGPSPLYTSFTEIADAMFRLLAIMESGEHLLLPAGRGEIA